MSGKRVDNFTCSHVDGLEKVKGKQVFMSDLRLPGMLWGKVVRSKVSHGKIKRINLERALALDGVHCIVTAEDIPHKPIGPFIPDWEILAREKVVFPNQEVAAVAAETREIAEEAAKLVEVEYEELPGVYDPEKAMEADAPLLYPEKGTNVAFTFDVEQGDVEKAFSESDYVREEEFYTHSAFHAYLEPNGSIVSYDKTENSYTMWAATQVPLKARTLYSKALGVPFEKLRLIQMPMGGGFGGKFESNFHLVAAVLSKKAEKPVRLVNSLEEEFYTAPLRVPMKIKIKMGLKKDGTITGKDVVIISDNGGRTNYGPAVLSTTCFRVDNLYKIFNTRAKGYLVYTNNASKGAMRGFGNPQMIFALEAMLDMLARDAGLDQAEVRKKNSFCNGDVSVHGWEINSCGLPECIDVAVRESGWNRKEANSEKKGTKKRGFGLACCNHVSSYRPIFPDFDGSIARVSINSDGEVTIFSGEVDIGQGYRTVAVQIAAKTLGIPNEWVKIAPVDSDHSPLGIGSLASRGTLMGGNAVFLAAGDLKEKIIRELSEILEWPVEKVTIENGEVVNSETGKSVDFREILHKIERLKFPIEGEGSYMANTVFPDPKTKYGNPSPAYSFAAHIAEVEVDTASGKIEVINYTAANDVGKAINPLLCKGQLEGGVLQGIGWILGEKIITGDGWIKNSNFLDYKMLTFADMVNVKPFLVEEPDPNGPFGAKSIGEPAFNPVAAAVSNAIFDAVGVRVTQIPILPEDLLEAMQKGADRV